MGAIQARTNGHSYRHSLFVPYTSMSPTSTGTRKIGLRPNCCAINLARDTCLRWVMMDWSKKDIAKGCLSAWHGGGKWAFYPYQNEVKGSVHTIQITNSFVARASAALHPLSPYTTSSR
ncbi:hypothetical protein PILCRDRAFT_680274 [Piloderma croceum F 1598]|uniref:Uncharacterized protein n=1 Tax=Piloderma croceum (strain F 1598) TaxID=765440 RepID=A0A0C3ERU6_PILCF|nr:hypothetical protein PILCRDRAFT_680274 [Piloderma croceum F 1598]